MNTLCKTSIVSLIASLLVMGLTHQAAASTSLGEAEGWNAFIFGDLNGTADTEGTLAVGGNMTAVSGYSVGIGTGYGPSMPESYGTEDYLVVGGDLDASGWQVQGGNAVVGGDTYYQGQEPIVTPWWTQEVVTFPGNNGNALTSNVGRANVGIDFDAARTDLIARSQNWASLAPTHTAVTDPFRSNMFFQGFGDLVVFNVVGDDLDSITRRFEVDPGATVLVNVSGTDISLGDDSWYVNGNNNLATFANEANILFNFYEAQTLSIYSTTLPGSVLAPHAHLTLSGGGINGQTIVNSAQQVNGGQFNNYSFNGSLPSGGSGTSASIPSPAAVWGGLGLIASVLIRRRSHN